MTEREVPRGMALIAITKKAPDNGLSGALQY
jgi:hypothetical protein